MTDMEDLKQLVAAAATAAENANATAERSFRLAEDNQHSILVLNQQMVSMQQMMLQMQADMRGMQADMRGIQVDMLEVKKDIRGLQQENRRILDVLLNQRDERED
ncbi:MAG: hypothetical protein VKL39_09330 [Leptolyngbyaceae bacterium]|nr:hypothetical protein [Leptolyngbyaceae bacterium]